MRTLLCYIVLLTGLVGCAPPKKTTLHVMCSGGLTAAYEVLAPRFIEQSGIELKTSYGASMGGASSSIPVRLDRGEPADVVILASGGLDLLIGEDKAQAESRVDLARSRVGMAVRAGEPTPDISTVQSFTTLLLEAESIAYSASASGTYLSTNLFPLLGIAEQLKDKSIRVVGERVGAVVARGEAEIGFQQVSELLPIEGITYAGPIPEAVQKITIFTTAITTGSANEEAARSLIQFLSSSQAADMIEETGMEALN